MRVIVKEDGTIQDRYNRYLAFGGDDGSSTTLNNAYKYTGKPFDDEHGFDLFYYGARYYDSFTGRFAAVDPMQAENPSLSSYVYVENNPLLLICAWQTPSSANRIDLLTYLSGLVKISKEFYLDIKIVGEGQTGASAAHGTNQIRGADGGVCRPQNVINCQSVTHLNASVGAPVLRI